MYMKRRNFAWIQNSDRLNVAVVRWMNWYNMKSAGVLILMNGSVFLGWRRITATIRRCYLYSSCCIVNWTVTYETQSESYYILLENVHWITECASYFVKFLSTLVWQMLLSLSYLTLIRTFNLFCYIWTYICNVLINIHVQKRKINTILLHVYMYMCIFWLWKCTFMASGWLRLHFLISNIRDLKGIC